MNDTTVPITAILIYPPPSPTFIQHNLISDGSVKGTVTDPSLINPWGLAASSTGPFWISDAGKGAASIHGINPNTDQVTANVIPPVIIEGHGGPSVPTGQVFNPFTANHPDNFVLANGKPASFLFVTAQGTINGWNGGTTAPIIADNSSSASYTGVAIGDSVTGPELYAANFANGTVDIFDAWFNKIYSFTDPNTPSGYAPFNVQNLDDKLYVTFAKRDPLTGRDVPGDGNGFVSTFDLNGHYIERVATGGALDSPWGVAIAPDSWSSLGGDLLVGNFGDGTIAAYDLETKDFEGLLNGANGKPIVNENLWALSPGNDASGGSKNSLYFTAGLQNEDHGLFGVLTPGPTLL